MALRRLGRKKDSKIINNIDMTSLIDLTFLLLITFIITMPAIEQGISVKLPQGKADALPVKKSNVVTLDAEGRAYLNNREITLEDLERTLGNLAADDPEGRGARARRRASGVWQGGPSDEDSLQSADHAHGAGNVVGVGGQVSGFWFLVTRFRSQVTGGECC